MLSKSSVMQCDVYVNRCHGGGTLFQVDYTTEYMPFLITS